MYMYIYATYIEVTHVSYIYATYIEVTHVSASGKYSKAARPNWTRRNWETAWNVTSNGLHMEIPHKWYKFITPLGFDHLQDMTRN